MKGHNAEADVGPETHEARSRAHRGDDIYVGRTAPDDALDVGVTGAEARSQQDREQRRE